MVFVRWVVYTAWWIVCTVICGIIFRMLSRRSVSPPKGTSRTLVVLGSGGHTTEIISVLDTLGWSSPQRAAMYSPVLFVVADTDTTSRDRVCGFMNEWNIQHHTFVSIRRSREVHQKWIHVPFQVLTALYQSVKLLYQWKPDVIICNGPGTSVPVVLAAFLLNMLGFINSRSVFVESIARVRTLSLSAKVLYYLVDATFVQWEEVHRKYARTVYVGRLS